MQLRSFILLGVCAVLGMGSAAFAGPANLATSPSVETTDAIPVVAAKSDASQLRLLKKKKNPTSDDLAQISKLEAKIVADKEAAKQKALEARKLAMREAAKAKADAARQEWLAKKGGGAAASEVADAKPAKNTTNILAPLEPIAPLVAVKAEEPIPAEAMNITATGNNGELRSEQPGQKQTSSGGLFAGLFGGASVSSISYLPETRALDSALAKKDAKRPFKVKPEFVPQDVTFTGYEPGTIVIDTSARRLYLVESFSTARRYAIAVGREGLQFKGTVAVGDKQEWPRWIPTLDMQKREPKHYGQYKDGMPGGGENPLGARAIYLYDGKKDTHLRIHGTIAPNSIGTSASNGCFRMINEHVMDLYSRVKIGTKVVII
ncbi:MULTISPECIES: L,D-transpeptidase family protein [unclassified Mesorhizobium]|uniref:L,D-transpeptidase family protein n=1 Tax=unclassified Mesorhizobium TaxID=325217 RepID=UPI000F750083|nr:MULTISPECIES: L,D-transpeptidase family protein [unclassified Mesorhizobium]AZO07204.1 L,D-transpeptidase [Mesorhizobium sp. M2A.F.Ca.ET.043.02.1.1]RUW41645.1 L,D-transpeptidase [Mesorhizobium sp. M2A.F.Ca.ET.015.02.1.1]RUW74092.1 L,D-transpeptidase [Mesorhizobium sp. M2A.F.Ca.ET.067.02.1.1]RVC93682.1 L,D-transpeptidase [Mesorhizobium sp. M2A.F.Ca.ET.017.03.2.1]RVD10107.1 L,D-transpeptidase [Mesorhizobium sp. M2A.F.Ca.ET.029.05.1.1]